MKKNKKNKKKKKKKKTESEKMVVNDTRISQKQKDKNQLSIEKTYKMRKNKKAAVS